MRSVHRRRRARGRSRDQVQHCKPTKRHVEVLANRKAGLATKCGNLSAKGIQQRSQSFAARPAPEFVERSCLNLADPFPRQRKTPADVLESVRVAVIES